MNPFFILLMVAAAALLCFVYLPTVYYKYIHPQTFQAHDSRGPDSKDGQSDPADGESHQAMMLTFDDGPDRVYTDRILDLLAANGVKATFFLVAEKAANHPETVARIVAEGHAVGFHGYNHKNMAYQGFFAAKRNFQQGLQLLREQLPPSAFEHNSQPIAYYRPPYGFLNPFTIYWAKKYNLTPVFWNVITQDWSDKSSRYSIIRKLRRGAKDGATILLHDSGEGTGGSPGAPENTLLALWEFLPEIKKKGFHFLLPSEALGPPEEEAEESQRPTVTEAENTCGLAHHNPEEGGMKHEHAS